jgi:hypothetical protein
MSMGADGRLTVTFKELKSDLQLGRIQVTKDPQRVRRAILMPVMAYLLLVRLYGKGLELDFQMSRHMFCIFFGVGLGRSITIASNVAPFSSSLSL